MYADHVSVMIERYFQEWIKAGKKKDPKSCQIMVDPEYCVDFSKGIQFHAYDSKRQRHVKRGEQGERIVRPSDERFMNNENFLVGVFRPVKKGEYFTTDCNWLGL